MYCWYSELIAKKEFQCNMILYCVSYTVYMTIITHLMWKLHAICQNDKKNHHISEIWKCICIEVEKNKSHWKRISTLQSHNSVSGSTGASLVDGAQLSALSIFFFVFYREMKWNFLYNLLCRKNPQQLNCFVLSVGARAHTCGCGSRHIYTHLTTRLTQLGFRGLNRIKSRQPVRLQRGGRDARLAPL